MIESLQKAAATIVRFVGLILLLGHTSRAVRAWFGSHFEELFTRFERLPQVFARQAYADRGFLELEKDILKRTEGGNTICVWIYGAGGCGKSTLSFALAKRLKGSRILPVIVNTELIGVFPIEDQVAVSVTPEGRRAPPTQRMIRRLLRDGSILLLVDGCDAESSAGCIAAIRSLIGQRKLRNVIFTSRAPPPPGVEGVRVGPLKDEEVNGFVAKYVTNADQRNAVSTKLRAHWGARGGINPLFAFMAIEQMVRGEDGATTVYELIQKYLCQLNTAAGAMTLSEVDFLRACRIAAAGCIEPNLWPHSIQRDFLRGMLAAEASRAAFVNKDGAIQTPERVLECLCTSGVVFPRSERMISFIEFVYHPIAEHLFVAFVHSISAGGQGPMDERRLIMASEGIRSAWQSWEGG